MLHCTFAHTRPKSSCANLTGRKLEDMRNGLNHISPHSLKTFGPSLSLLVRYPRISPAHLNLLHGRLILTPLVFTMRSPACVFLSFYSIPFNVGSSSSSSSSESALTRLDSPFLSSSWFHNQMQVLLYKTHTIYQHWHAHTCTASAAAVNSVVGSPCLTQIPPPDAPVRPVPEASVPGSPG